MEYDVLTYNLHTDMTAYRVSKGYLNKRLTNGENVIYLGFQEVPKAVLECPTIEQTHAEGPGERSHRFYPLERYPGGNLMIEFRRVAINHDYSYGTGIPVLINAIVGADKIAFINVHRSPSDPNNNFWYYLWCLLARLISGGRDAYNREHPPMKGIVLVGDFNADISRIGTNNQTVHDKALYNLIDDFSLKSMNDSGDVTFFNHNTRATLDYIFTTQNFTLHSQYNDLLNAGSDHTPLFVRIAYRETPLQNIPSGMPELRFGEFVTATRTRMNLFHRNHY
uniref:Endonuclease/exonuclease/phosphatase domain-containing protein n=1 Tax=Tetranychus urticae TaxID=32264 RepID=T1JR20_TETUR